MKKVDIVYCASGEFKGRYAPLCFLSSFTGDIRYKTIRRISHDTMQTDVVPLYRLAEFKLPEWMTESIFLNNYDTIKSLHAFGLGLNCTETEFFNLARLNDRYRFFIAWLRKKYKNRKNPFMAKILDNVNLWLSAEDPAYPLPLSAKQWDAATRYCPLSNADIITKKIIHLT